MSNYILFFVFTFSPAGGARGNVAWMQQALFMQALPCWYKYNQIPGDRKKHSVAEWPVGGAKIAAESTAPLQNKSKKSEMNEDNDAFSFLHFIFPSCAMTLDVGDI